VKWMLRMKLIYIGTNIISEQHKTLRVLAAERGESVSSILKKLVTDFLAKSAKKGGAK